MLKAKIKMVLFVSRYMPSLKVAAAEDRKKAEELAAQAAADRSRAEDLASSAAHQRAMAEAVSRATAASAHQAYGSAAWTRIGFVSNYLYNRELT